MSTSSVLAEALPANSAEAAVAPAPATARVLKKSLLVLGRASSCAGNVDLVVHNLLFSSLTGDAERFHGRLHLLQRQRHLEGEVVWRVDKVQDVDRTPVLALGVVDRYGRGQNVLALERGSRALVGTDAHRLEGRRQLQERSRIPEGAAREGELRCRRHFRPELTQRRGEGVSVRHLVVADGGYLLEERVLEYAGLDALSVERALQKLQLVRERHYRR